MSQQDIRALRAELSALRKEVRALSGRTGRGLISMEEVLRRRGIAVARSNPADDLLFSSHLSARRFQCFYDLVKKYSFRLFLRDVIRRQSER